jgi:hypothetical protein
MADLQAMNIVIGANVSQATQGLNTVSQALANTATAAVKVDSSIGKIGASSYTTRFAVQNMANVFRDLPFAINNPAIGATVLDHVLASVQALKSETGSLKGAFGALASSLSGTGGVLVALNLLGAAVSLYSQFAGGASKATKEHAKTIDEYAEAIKRATTATAQQYDQVSKLVAQSQLSVTTQGQQKTILKELQQINSEYFGNLKIENGLITGLNTAYDEYANNILKVAKAKAAAETVGKLTDELLKTKEATLDIEKNFTNLNLSFKTAGNLLKDMAGANGFDKMANASKKVDDILAKMYPTLEDMAFLSAATGLSEQKIRDFLGDRLQLKTKEAQLTAEIAADSSLIGKSEIGAVATTSDHTKKVKEQKDAYEELLKILYAYRKLGYYQAADLETPPSEPMPIIPPSLKLSDLQAQAALINMRDALQKAGKKVFSSQGILTDVNLLNDAEVTKNFGKLQDDIKFTASLVTGTLQTAFESVFQAIDQGKNVFVSLGTAIKQLIVHLAEAAAEAAVLALVMNVFFPGAGAVSKFSLKGFQDIFKSLGHFATGGVVTRPTFALVGEQGPERITPLNQISNSGNNMIAGEVVFTISGQVIRGILNRANQTAYNTF